MDLEPADAGARAALIEKCPRHYWWLHLDAATPDVVLLSCEVCPATVEDIWPGTTPYIYMVMGGFTIADGSHSLKTGTVDLAVDVRIRETDSLDLQTMQFESRKEVFVTPRVPALEEGSSGDGAGWCAPSP